MPAESLVEVTVCPLKAPADKDLLAHLELRALPDLTSALGRSVACYVTEPAENNFPALPVRADDSVLVWITRSESSSGVRDTRALTPDLTSEVLPTLKKYLDGPTETMRLSPTPRSRLR